MSAMTHAGARPLLPDLSGRAAIVTGGGRGIGRAIAQTLAAAGAGEGLGDGAIVRPTARDRA